MNLKFLRFLLQLGKKLSLTLLILLCLPVSMVRAQIEPDGSMPTNVEELRDLLMEISGGEVSGDNLFHSFDEFSIPEGAEAVFQNADSIENIFARVTGDSASLIDGMLSTQGDANLFLMNPNGIVFGEDATLNVGGSFIGTTADSVVFEDGTEFAANDDGSDPVLSVEVPIGLGFGSNPGAITVNGDGNQLDPISSFAPISTDSDSSSGLSVESEETIGLLGGDINVNGGSITAQTGNLELGAVSSGFVDIEYEDPGLDFAFDNATVDRNLVVDNRSLLNTGGGSIKLTGQNIDLVNGSYILNQTQEVAKDISINANNTLTLSGVSPDGSVSNIISAETLGTAKGSDITISTQDLVLQDAASIRASSFSNATGGNTTIDASRSILLGESIPPSQNRQFNTNAITTPALSSGNSGNIQISTPQLRVFDGSYISSSTGGSGNGGNLTLNTDRLEVSGVSTTSPSNISAAAFNDGNAGNVIVNGSEIIVEDGAIITTTSVANGNAGNVELNASESVNINSQTNSPPSTINSAVSSADARTQQVLQLSQEPTGDAGNVIIRTPNLDVDGGGAVSVQNAGTGNAGTLSISAGDLNLNNASSITAASSSGQGGNITLDTDNLQIDPNSNITAEAENQGDGGNININASNIFAKKSSAVTADAEGGDGGNLTIEAINILLEAPVEDIFTASSELGIDGTVEIETDGNFEGSFDLVKPDFAVAEKALEGSCFEQRNARQGKFVYGGTGGLPVSPDNMVPEERSYSTRLRQVEPGLSQPNPLETNSPPQSDAGEVEPQSDIVVEPESEWPERFAFAPRRGQTAFAVRAILSLKRML